MLAPLYGAVNGLCVDDAPQDCLILLDHLFGLPFSCPDGVQGREIILCLVDSHNRVAGVTHHNFGHFV